MTFNERHSIFLLNLLYLHRDTGLGIAQLFSRTRKALPLGHFAEGPHIR